MNNPFNDSSDIKLSSGFYFDKERNLICFYHKEEGEMYTSISIYNRYLGYQVSRYSMFSSLRGDENMTEPKDLVELTSSLLKDRESLFEDFKWLASEYKVGSSFIEFLTEEEKYSILTLFQTYINVTKDKK